MTEEEVVFGTKNLREGTQPFVGKVEFAQMNCNCPDCRAGKVSAEEKGIDIDNNKSRIHIKIAPKEGEAYDKKQNLWVTPSKTKDSTWGKFNKQMEKLGIIEELQEKGLPAIEGRSFVWERMEYEVGFNDREVSNWIPVELAD